MGEITAPQAKPNRNTIKDLALSIVGPLRIRENDQLYSIKYSIVQRHRRELASSRSDRQPNFDSPVRLSQPVCPPTKRRWACTMSQLDRYFSIVGLLLNVYKGVNESRTLLGCMFCSISNSACRKRRMELHVLRFLSQLERYIIAASRDAISGLVSLSE